ncbi:MAG: NUDIX domain-containing protein [Cytophagaceae bacterium]|nr:NUDIX domain-containing protein [Cytophagaceae bacterium]
MVIFINDRPLRLTDAQRADLLQEKKEYDVVVDVRLDAIRPQILKGHVLILNASPATVDRVLKLLHETYPADLQSVALQVANKKQAEEKLKSHFRVVKAAGGVIFNGDRVLLMYRLKRWDLPKGKLDPNEKSRDAALREVEEETGILAELEEKICTTWHTYTQNNNRILKRTKWYRMSCLDDSAMAPQWEENIERLAWMDKKEVQNALVDSYSSIRYVFERLWKQEILNDQ